MKSKYTFSVLRYTYDQVTQEFINVGIALQAPEQNFLQARCTMNYRRITSVFSLIEGTRFRELLRYIESQVNKRGGNLVGDLRFEGEVSLAQTLASILPVDDSALQFIHVGQGVTENPVETLNQLYSRYVDRYKGTGVSERRNDEDVWRVFRAPLEKLNVVSSLTPKRIVAPNYEYDFQRSWKNEVWHVYEPVSFDYNEANSILEKANRWLGRATSLQDSADPFMLHLLLGAPKDRNLKLAYFKAQNLLNKMPGRYEFVEEQRADDFARDLQREIRTHQLA